jgi:hypothetical protein
MGFRWRCFLVGAKLLECRSLRELEIRSGQQRGGHSVLWLDLESSVFFQPSLRASSNISHLVMSGLQLQ